MIETFLIAEIAQAHNGSIEVAHKYIDALAKTGVNAIKFQTHIAEAESSIFEPFRVKFTDEYNSRFDYWRAMEFTFAQWKGLKLHCDELGVEFMSSPFSNAAVDLLEDLGVKRYKIGSGEVNNLLLLERIAQTGKPVILSSGMSSLEEIDASYDFLRKRDIEVSILQCKTRYPTCPQDYGLNLIKELKERYEVKVGFSDHSAKIETCISAFSLGAEILEFHAVFDRDKDKGPDAKASLEISEIKRLVSAIENIAKSLNSSVNKTDISDVSHLKEIFEKSLSVNKVLNKGHILQFEDLEAKKPKGRGIPANEFENVLGKRICRTMDKWEFLNKSDFLDEC